MALTAYIPRLTGTLRTLGMAGDIGSAGMGGLAIAGVTLTAPWSLVAAAGLLGVAGYAVWKGQKAEQDHDAKADQIRTWVESFARSEACRKRGLAAAIEERRRTDPDALKGLPAEITDDHLATFLTILASDGEAQTRLLGKHDKFVRAVSATTLRHLADVRHDLERVGFETALTLADVRELREVVQLSRDDTAELLRYARLNRQPPIAIEVDATRDDRTRFVFRQRRLTCVGRDSERTDLGAWLDDPRPFSWDLWTGHAGMGKSRVALELCLERQETWDVGFYQWDRDADRQWQDWKPEFDTLIVFDYVAQHAERIRCFLDRFARYAGSPRVRMLLLERPIPRFERPQARGDGKEGFLSLNIGEQGWWTTLDAGSGSSLRAAHARRYEGDRPDRELTGISEPALDAMVTQEWAEATGSTAGLDLAKVRPLIAKITPDRRPLYIAMAAEAVREHKHVPDAETLIEHIRDKESDKHWTPALKNIPTGRGDAAAYRRLMCLATMCGGLGGKTLTALLDDPAMADGAGTRLVPSSGQYDRGDIYGRLVPDADGNSAPKLEPDLLGECFALQHLATCGRADRKMVEVAWRHAPKGLLDFARRAAMNFPNHPGLDEFSRALPHAVPDAARAWLMKSRISALLAASDAAMIGAIGRFALQRPDLGEQEESTALFAVLSGSADEELLSNVIPRVRVLARDTENAMVRENLAMGLSDAISSRSLSGDWVDCLLQELRNLRNAHREDESLRDELAAGLNNAIEVSGSEIRRINRFLEELRCLRSEHPKDDAMLEHLAVGLERASEQRGGDFNYADNLLNELSTLRETDPDSYGIAESEASALISAIMFSESEVSRAADLLGRLQARLSAGPKLCTQLIRGMGLAIRHSGAPPRHRAVWESFLAMFARAIEAAVPGPDRDALAAAVEELRVAYRAKCPEQE
ncbi:MAG: hypothetical protein DYG94_12065 [Leptolyngbya sp. PLA3]|nr:MAG: hypothetical protein EDM82_05390 [Cyanobacteria bacterium CYA]MCE7969460.1 hypothetical protein [Leptolyngbya sp. PL-A3]